MGGAVIPTLGFPSRTTAVLAMRAESMSDAVIAEKIGITVNAVSGLASSARRGPRHAEEPHIDYVEQAIRSKLRRHAAKRGISVDSLIDRIVYTVATENLVDAVLDDREGGVA